MSQSPPIANLPLETPATTVHRHESVDPDVENALVREIYSRGDRYGARTAGQLDAMSQKKEEEEEPRPPYLHVSTFASICSGL